MTEYDEMGERLEKRRVEREKKENAGTIYACAFMAATAALAMFGGLALLLYIIRIFIKSL